MGKRESQATIDHRKEALKFLLNKCLKCDIDFGGYTYRSTRKNINTHRAYSQIELTSLMELAKENKEMYALVRLLYDMGARIQDAVGLTFGQVLGLKPKNGRRSIHLAA